jgi:hypothetical protein
MSDRRGTGEPDRIFRKGVAHSSVRRLCVLFQSDMSDQRPESELLCESCGYSLEGIARSGQCPECGRSIESSLPDGRTGSPWQRSRGIASWLATNWGTLRRPRERFTTLRIERAGAIMLMATNCLAAAVLLVAPWSDTLIGDPARAVASQPITRKVLTYAWVFPLQVVAAASLLFVLTWVEYRGVRFFANKRRWRVSRDAAFQIGAHACVGWIVGALIPLMALAILFAAPAGRPSLLDRMLSRGGGLGYTSLTGGDATLLGVVFGSYILGLLVFETLVYIGVRRCRFANAPRSAPTVAAESTSHAEPKLASPE